jgi:DNA-binding transcriptional LysR family regulator
MSAGRLSFRARGTRRRVARATAIACSFPSGPKRMDRLDLNDVHVFVRVVERGGFAKVAREENVPTSTVSRAVSRLEHALGVRLVDRTSRTMRVTDDGRAFFASVAPAVAAVGDAARDLESVGRTPHGRLRVSASGDVGTTLLPRIVTSFVEECPNVEIEIDLASRRVNLVEEGFDLAVRAGPLDDSSLVARKLGDVDLALYASAAYVERHGTPSGIDEIGHHRCVLFRPRAGAAEWALTSGDGKDARVAVRGRIGGNDYSFVRAAVAAGAGIGLLPRVVAEAGSPLEPLLRVLPDLAARGGALYAVHPSSKHVPPKVTAFRDFLAESFAKLADVPAARGPSRKKRAS